MSETIPLSETSFLSWCALLALTQLWGLTVPVCPRSCKSDWRPARLNTVTVMISSACLTLILTALLLLITGVNIILVYYSAYITCFLKSIYSSSQLQTSGLSFKSFTTCLLLSLSRERFYHKVEFCFCSAGSIGFDFPIAIHLRVINALSLTVPNLCEALPQNSFCSP